MTFLWYIRIICHTCNRDSLVQKTPIADYGVEKSVGCKVCKTTRIITLNPPMINRWDVCTPNPQDPQLEVFIHGKPYHA